MPKMQFEGLVKRQDQEMRIQSQQLEIERLRTLGTKSSRAGESFRGSGLS